VNWITDFGADRYQYAAANNSRSGDPAMSGSSPAPNLYNVSGGGIHVVYSTSGIDGKPHLSYHDSFRSLNFTGDQIRTVSVGDLGTIVSVTVFMTVDTGSTSFSLIVPPVNLGGNFSVPISTDGITTAHRFSVVPAFSLGQRNFYTVTAMTGTAAHVVF
jgi:hypothetical protein